MLAAFDFSFLVKIIYDSIYTREIKARGQGGLNVSVSAYFWMETFFHLFAENLPILLIFYFHVRHFVRKTPVIEEEDSD